VIEDSQKNHHVKFTVYDKDLNRNEEIGVAFASLAPCFDGGEVKQQILPVQHSSGITDKDLGM